MQCSQKLLGKVLRCLSVGALTAENANWPIGVCYCSTVYMTPLLSIHEDCVGDWSCLKFSDQLMPSKLTSSLPRRASRRMSQVCNMDMLK